MGRLYKTGGRKKGTPNKRTSLVERLLEKMEADPIGHMSRVMMDEGADARLRFDCARELAQYIAPKRKALEVREESDSPEGPRFINVQWCEAENGKPKYPEAVQGSARPGLQC